MCQIKFGLETCALAVFALVAMTGSHAQTLDPEKPVATLNDVTIISNSPVGKTGIAANKFPGNVQTLSGEALNTSTTDLTQKLNQSLGSVNVNDTQGNPFTVDVNYRGFTASPSLGTPQGLSVFLDGMRINEPFGDVVSWDLIPQIVIDKVTVIPGSNPVYGLNTLGGAISMSAKSGASFTGSQGGIGIGSFGRKTIDVEHGSQTDSDNLYFAASLYNDEGWAANNPSRARQFFGKYSTNGQYWDGSLSLMLADNLLYGNQTVPLSMLDQAAQGYSHPDYIATKNVALNAVGNFEINALNSFTGNLYYRHLKRDILNSNVGSLISDATNDASCLAHSPIDCPATNLLAQYKQELVGVNGQWNNTTPIWSQFQTSTIGVNAEFSHTGFGNFGQYANVDSSRGLVGLASYMTQADINSNSQRLGLFGTSTFDVSENLSATASARYDYASLKLSGQSCVDNDLCNLAAGLGSIADVSGDHAYQRLNPSVGMTYQIAPLLTGFANYAEGFRAPSAIELACSDPTAPCSGVPNAFGADPELQSVVSKTYEVGMRGSGSKYLIWRAAYYHTLLQNDILFNQSSLTTGYFSNVGQTLRQGFELGLEGKIGQLRYSMDLDLINASYQTGFDIANTANSAFSVPVKPGDLIPGIPRWVYKANVSYPIAANTRFSLTVQSQGPHYARGDENNADVNGQVPGYTVFKVDLQHGINKTFNLYAGINNLFDVRYANYAALAVNNITTGSAEQFRSLGAPRSVYAGVQAKF
jgi:outer membrane receptor protein involved in Fe transport